MSKLFEIRPFGDDDLEAAAALLAERHRRHRRLEPLLPERYERVDEARAAVEGAWRKEGASGVAAARDGRVVGYLIGAPDDEASWGPNEWIDHPGHAAEEPELLRDLYAALAAPAVRAGRTRHYVLIPAGDPAALDAWYRLGFGQQQAYGILEVEEEPWPERVREATVDDLEAVLPLTIVISRHHAGSPVFSDNASRRVERYEASLDGVRAQLREDVEAGEIATLVAEVDGRVVGFLEACAAELSGGVDGHATLARPDNACYLAFAATDPQARGLGTGVELTSAAFAWAHRAGYASMVTDWRVPNLLASRFWPRRGFRTTFLRLYRSIP